MEYMIGCRNGGFAETYTTLESANEDARDLSVNDPTDWFDVVDEAARVVAVWHDGKCYQQCEIDDVD
jgi:hypothetical protein